MIIKTKYNFGDRPWKIGTDPIKNWNSCSFCKGKGNIAGQDRTSETCPKCYGHKGKWIFTQTGFRVISQLTIGEIRVQITGKDPIGTPGHELFSNYGPQKAKHEEVYMCKETGIGSGSLHYVSTLWPTKKEAKAECEKRNKNE